MRLLPVLGVSCLAAFAAWSCGSATVSSTDSAGPGSAATATGDAEGKLTGFAFVDSSVAAAGAQAKLPAGTKIYPPGSKITGTEGCSTNRYHTDGQPIVIIDYTGRPTAGSVQVTRHPASGGTFPDPPYYIDLNAGRTLQNMGPIFDNGTYDVLFSYNYNQGAGKKVSGTLVLARSCPTAP